MDEPNAGESFFIFDVSDFAPKQIVPIWLKYGDIFLANIMT